MKCYFMVNIIINEGTILIFNVMKGSVLSKYQIL